MRNCGRRNSHEDRRPADWRRPPWRRALGRNRTHAAFVPMLWLLLAGAFVPPVPPAFAWEYWGGDPGGTRYAALDQITPGNVGNLTRAWEFRTGDLARR